MKNASGPRARLSRGRRSRSWCGRALLLVAIVGALGRPAQSQPTPAPPVDADRAWIELALGAWKDTCVQSLKIDPFPLPAIVLFDSSHIWSIYSDASESARLLADPRTVSGEITYADRKIAVLRTPHSGTVKLPDGQDIPARLTSFSGVSGPGNRPFFVMAMPAVWHAEPRHKGEATLDLLIRCVLVHEMTHTRQIDSVGPRMADIQKRAGVGDDFDDDIIQDRFGEKPGFKAAYEKERDLIYQAVATPDRERRRALAAKVLAAMKARRARFFKGPEAPFADFEDLFLSMEGLAQWAGSRTAARSGLSDPEVLTLMRRGGRKWSQDEGLAVFLLVDSLVPGWQEKVFARSPASVLDLLTLAARK